MAFEMDGEIELSADRQTVWEALNDPEVLKQCIPGCNSLELGEDNSFVAAVKIKIGPIRASFSGSVTLAEIDEPNGYKISGNGNGGVAGYASGTAYVRLRDSDGCTRLSYQVESKVGGKIAQLGSRLINSVAKRYTDEFFACFAELVGPQQTADMEARQ